MLDNRTKHHPLAYSEAALEYEAETNAVTYLYLRWRETERKLLEQYGVTITQAAAVCWLCREGSVTTGEMAEMMGYADSSTTALVDALKRKGLVERVHSKVDRRVWMLTPTESGRKLAEALDT